MPWLSLSLKFCWGFRDVDVCQDSMGTATLRASMQPCRANAKGSRQGAEELRTCSPPGDDDWKDAGVDGEDGDEDVGGRGESAHDVGPHAAAVHELHEQAEPALEQRAVLGGEHDLEVTLRSSSSTSAALLGVTFSHLLWAPWGVTETWLMEAFDPDHKEDATAAQTPSSMALSAGCKPPCLRGRQASCL